MYEPSVQLGIATLLFGTIIISHFTQRIMASNERRRWDAEMKLRDKKYEGDRSLLTNLIEKNYEILSGAIADSRAAVLQMTKLVERVGTMQRDNDVAFRDLFEKTDAIAKRKPCTEHQSYVDLVKNKKQDPK